MRPSSAPSPYKMPRRPSPQTLRAAKYKKSPTSPGHSSFPSIDLSKIIDDDADDEQLEHLRGSPTDVTAAIEDIALEAVPTSFLEARGDRAHVHEVVAVAMRAIITLRGVAEEGCIADSLAKLRSSVWPMLLQVQMVSRSDGTVLERWDIGCAEHEGTVDTAFECRVLEKQISRTCAYLSPLDEPAAVQLRVLSAHPLRQEQAIQEYESQRATQASAHGRRKGTEGTTAAWWERLAQAAVALALGCFRA